MSSKPDKAVQWDQLHFPVVCSPDEVNAKKNPGPHLQAAPCCTPASKSPSLVSMISWLTSWLIKLILPFVFSTSCWASLYGFQSFLKQLPLIHLLHMTAPSHHTVLRSILDDNLSNQWDFLLIVQCSTTHGLTFGCCFWWSLGQGPLKFHAVSLLWPHTPPPLFSSVLPLFCTFWLLLRVQRHKTQQS